MSVRTSAAGIPTTEPDPTNELPARAADVPAFPCIYQRYFDFVWTSARGLGVGSDAIDDVVQEVFIVIHARLNTLRDPTALRSWIYGIVRRTAWAQRRAQRSRSASALDCCDDSIPESGLPTPFESADQSDKTRLLWRLLAEVDEPKREIFIMAELAEMTTTEIAQTLEIPIGTVWTRLRAARKAFEAALARHNAIRKRGGNS